MFLELVSDSEETPFDGKWIGESIVFLGGKEVMSGDISFGSQGGVMGGSGVVGLGALGNNGGVLFSCCNKEATREVGVVVAVVVGVFPNRALDLKQGATVGNTSKRSNV